MRSFLSMRFLMYLAALQAVGLLVIPFPFVLPVYLLALAAGVWLVHRDFRCLPRDSQFRAALVLPNRSELGAICELTVGVSPLERLRVPGRITVIAPALREVLFRRIRKEAEWQKDRFEARFDGEVRRLGRAVVEGVDILIESPAGFWVRRLSVAGSAVAMRVVPARKMMPRERFEAMIGRQPTLLQGTRIARGNTSPDLYYTSREYRYPDPMRFIDRRKSARYGKLYTKLFDPIQQQHLIVMVDLGRGACGDLNGSARADYYVAAAHALAETALSHGDQVSVLCFSDRIHLRMPRMRSLRQLEPLISGNADLRARPVASDYALMGRSLRGAQRSLAIVLADCSLPSVQTEILPCLSPICSRHATCLAGILDREVDLGSSLERVDASTMSEADYSKLLYSYALTRDFGLFTERVSRLGGCTLSIPDEHWIYVVLKIYERLRASLYS